MVQVLHYGKENLIKLNQLIGKEILIGKVKIKGHRLCDPCKYLHNKLQQNSLLKNMVHLYQMQIMIDPYSNHNQNFYSFRNKFKAVGLRLYR